MEIEWIKLLLRPDTIVSMIPLSAIFVGGIIAIAMMVIRHRERMALIEQGLHPGHLDEEPLPEDKLSVQ